MLNTHLYSHSNRSSIHQAPTIRIHPDEVRALRQAEAWGTLEPAPRRAPRRTSSVDWTLYAVAALSLTLTGAALGLTIVIGAAATYVSWPEVTSSLAAASTPEHAVHAPAAHERGTTAKAAVVSVPSRTESAPQNRAAPATTRRTATRRSPAAAAKSADRDSMSLSEYRRYLTEQANSRVTRSPTPYGTAAAPAPAAPAPQTTLATAPAPRAPARRTTRTTRTRTSPPAAPAPVATHSSNDDFYTKETIHSGEDLMATPAASPSNAPQRLSGRLSQANNGVWILDDPLDPVAISLRTDGDAAVYVDGELIGGAPLAVVVELGSHELLIQSETGTESFSIDAAHGDRICVSVKKGPKLTSCKKL